ncbi:MAG: outer membrane protein assembly factor BamA [Deltaproteobacteria bacterium]|nr:outer membrane protein assembly factor BamA [Deltaproteobacteria bacterium]
MLVLPFDIHSKTDISALRRLIMDSVAGSLDERDAEIVGLEEIRSLMLKQGVEKFDEEKAFEIAKRVKADFAVLGSITRLGNTTNVDWRIIDLTDKNPVAFYFKSSVSETEMLMQLKASAAPMQEKMVSALSARPAVKSGTIDKIIITGNRRVDTEAIASKLTVKAGEPFSPDDVKEDVRKIYATGFFDDVVADLSDTASGKILTFRVKEMPFIKKIEFKGNKEVKEEKIKEVLTLKENTALDRVLLNENAEKIKALYSQEGYYLTTVKPVVTSDGLEATILYQIDEGPAVKVKRITFIGNKFFSDKELKDFMSTNEVGFFTALTSSGKFNEYVFQNDIAIIMSKYFDKGFINADIVEERVLLSEDKKWFFITIALSEGDQFKVGKIDVEGEILTSKEELIEKIKLKSGEVFNRTKLAKGIEAITDAYGDKGYAYADIKPVTKVDPASKTIDITIDTKKNELVYIERIDISGNLKTRDKVIRRELELGEGDLFGASELKRSRNNLRRLGYFEDVRIAQTQGSAPDKIKLDVDVKERPTGSISLGFGYSSVDKLIGTASVAQSNFMGTGLKLDLSGTVSASSSKYILGITEPWLFDKPLSAGFDIYNTDREYPDFNLSKKGFDIRFGFPIHDRYTKGYLTYKLEDVRITNVADTASTFIKEQEGTSTESSIRAQIRRDTRDDAFFPTEGHVVNIATEFAGGFLGGSSYFIKYEADAVKYFAMPWETTFSVRGSAGYVQGYQGHEVPIYERYYLGGINTIRGFETRTISPKDPATGDLIGGNTMMVVNTEFLFPLFPEQNIKGLLFVDVGNSYKGKIDFERFKAGAGFGIRWFSPLGPLRLEMGFNLDPKAGESDSQFEFAIGSAF